MKKAYGDGLIILFAILLTTGCVRGRGENTSPETANENLIAQASSNKPRFSADAIVRYVGGAKQAVALGNWQDAFANLKAMQERVEATLEDPSSAAIAPQLNDLKKLISRATSAVDSHSSEALPLLDQLQTAAFALKMQVSQ